MLHLEYSLRTEKKTPQHKSTYTINTWHCNRGKHIQLWQAAIRSSAIYFGAGQQTCSTGGGTKRFYRGSWMGEGSNVRSWGRGGKRFKLHRSHRVVIQTALAKAPVRGARKDKIKLLWLWGEQLQSAAHSLCPFWSLKSPSFTSKAVSFIMMVSIFRFIVSVSLLTALPTASIKTGSLVRLWTAVPVFWIFR